VLAAGELLTSIEAKGLAIGVIQRCCGCRHKSLLWSNIRCTGAKFRM
jgi:hypothetical protein